MVVRTAVSGMRGRHSSSGSGPPRAPIRVVLAVLGACLAIAGGTVAGLAAAGPGGHRAPGATAGTTGATSSSRSASQLNLTASAPMASPQPRSPRGSSSPGSSPRATPAAGPTAAAGRDPFGSAAASYLSGRAGTVLAAVYDLGTGRTWHLGQGQPQAEASIVKVDVLETLLAEHDQDGGTGLSAADRSLTQQMIEDSDNDAATSLWYQPAARPGSARSTPGPA